MKTNDLFSLFLLNKKIYTVFGMIGSANSYLFDSFQRYGIRIINIHNEQCAVIAAGAYYKTTGKLAVALVTAGGGASNSITGILSLWADSTPAIILTGQESSNYITEHHHRRMYGTQGFDVVHMTSKITKYSKTIMDKVVIQDELEKAYSIMMNGRKGPILLDIPFNVQNQDIEYREWNEYVLERIDDGFDIMNFRILLSESKRPVIIAGNGVKLSNSKELFKQVIQKIQIPVCLTWSGIDILEDSHPLYIGRPGIYGQRAANFILQKSDLVIVLGSRLTLPQSGYDFNEFVRHGKVIMVDIDTTEFKPFVDISIHCDCHVFLNNISDFSYTNPDWIEECKLLQKQFPNIEDDHKDDVFLNSYKIIDKISDYLKPDQIIVTDMGTALLSGHQVIRLKEGQIMFSSYGLGEMGYGLPAALGAAISSPEREVLCLNCDGGMMLNLQELQTIIQHKLKVKILIFNNDGYLMIKHTQKMLFNGKYNSVDSNTGIVLPDYMQIAQAFGYTKYRIKTWDEFDLLFSDFMDYNGPAICEIFTPPNQDFIPKVKGVVNENGSIFAPPIEEMSPLLSYDTIKNIMGDYISNKSDIILRNQL
jgi:acetolactate synthase I/II/III large subunit